MLKRGLGAVQRLENATKKRNIRFDTRTTNWPFRDIAELVERCLFIFCEGALRYFISYGCFYTCGYDSFS